MIGQAILGEVVGANLLGTIPGLDHGAPFIAYRFGLLALLQLEQPAAQNLQPLGLVLDLAAFILAAYDHAGRQMRDLDGAVGRVHSLTAWTAGGRDIEAQIL